jgi:hypothetical protein
MGEGPSARSVVTVTPSFQGQDSAVEEVSNTREVDLAAGVVSSESSQKCAPASSVLDARTCPGARKAEAGVIQGPALFSE